MIVFIITLAAVLGLIFGLRTAWTATTAGETVPDARLHGLLGGFVVFIFALCVLFALYGFAWVCWWVAMLGV